MNFVYIRHAIEMLVERDIDRVWVERTVHKPDSVEPDPDHAERTRAFRVVPERDGRVLRVVYERVNDDVRIITLFFDRSRKQKR